MATYLDGMKGGKHNSDNAEGSFKKKKVTRKNIGAHLFDYQLDIIGKGRVDIIDDDKWRFNNTLTLKQYNEFKDYAIKLLQKTFKYRKQKAVDTFEWWWMRFGLRIKN